MAADYSFYVKTIETHARAFLTLNIYFYISGPTLKGSVHQKRYLWVVAMFDFHGTDMDFQSDSYESRGVGPRACFKFIT